MLDFQLGLQYGSGTGSRWLSDKEWGGGKKKKTTKVSLQVLNFTLSHGNHFAKYKLIFSHIQTAKYSIIFTFLLQCITESEESV